MRVLSARRIFVCLSRAHKKLGSNNLPNHFGNMAMQSSGPELRGGGITLESILAPTDVSLRQTKIVCTLGPACWEIKGPNQLEELIDSGLSVARFNFSHGDHETHKATLGRLREAAKNKGKHIAVLLDTKGPEIRSGFFANNVSKVQLNKGDTLVLTTDYSFKGDNTKLACTYEALPTSVKPGQQILVADGSLVLTVLECNPSAGEVACRVENNASIGERKNMNLPGVVVELPTLTEKDITDITEWGIPNDIDFIAASFVRKASDIHKIREVLGEGSRIKIIAKIENQEGLDNYDEILEATDGIMVARGDLGMEIPPEKVFLAQKMMIRKANIAGKPVITATQMLESMIVNPRPTRAECSDVANAVLDGTDCVMLSGETAGGANPTAAVQIMASTCVEAESAVGSTALYQAVRNSTLARYGGLGTSESIASSAVKTCIDVNAKAIVVCSESGATATQIAKFRPGRPITVLTTSGTTARQCYGVLKGCNARILPSLDHTDEIVSHTIQEFIKEGIASPGDAIVVVHGTSNRVGATNVMRIQYA